MIKTNIALEPPNTYNVFNYSVCYDGKSYIGYFTSNVYDVKNSKDMEFITECMVKSASNLEKNRHDGNTG